jgi:hypothetical protein
MTHFVDKLLPKSAGINRVFGGGWLLASGLAAIVFAYLFVARNPAFSFALFSFGMFVFCFLLSLIFWNNNTDYVVTLMEVLKACAVVLIVMILSSVDWFPSRKFKFDYFVTWIVMCWLLQVVGVIRFGLVSLEKSKK